MANLRLIIAQVLAGVTLALALTTTIAGPHIVATELAAALGVSVITAGPLGAQGLLVLAAASFVLSLKRRSFLVAGLLIASGVALLMSLIAAYADLGHQMSAMDAMHEGAFGLPILGLGVAKGIETRRMAKTSVT